MKSVLSSRWFTKHKRRGFEAARGTRRLANRQRFIRPAIEGLEPRLMMAADDVISVGRVLSSWSVSDIQNNRETITYTVYNQQASEAMGVLLTTTLQPGVTFQSASQLPDQSGQNLAWSLGTIPAFGRASIDVIVTFPGAIPLQLDSGTAAFATVDAAAVTDTAPAAQLRAAHIDPVLLAATPDANSNDPFIQAVAAKYDYDPNQFFQFLTEDIGYESYLGSLRGARGTLWSGAGNALDEASLGIALLRSSGIPARYVQGTLSDADSREQILSMFPATFQGTGYITPGTPTADPANDPQLLSETRQHFWVQFDAGNGFVDADSSFTAAQLGQTFAANEGSFSETPAALRHTATIQLVAEITSTANSLFGLSGGTETTVLDVTFDMAELVGHPLTIGHQVNQTALGAIFTAQTNTYSPFLQIGDEARLDSSGDSIIRGTDYQEVLTNFPFGSQILTGLFLKVLLEGPGQATETHQRTLVDRIGIAARHNGGGGIAAIPPDGAAIISPLDLTTLNVMPGFYDSRLVASYEDELASLATKLESFRDTNAADPTASDNPVLASQSLDLLRRFVVEVQRSRIATFYSGSDQATQDFAAAYHVASYFDSPRLTIIQAKAGSSGTNGLQLGFTVDLLKDDVRVLAEPGQNPAAAYAYQMQRGFLETSFETSLLNDLAAGGTSPAVTTPVSAQIIIDQAQANGIPLLALLPDHASELDALDLPAGAKALISEALATGNMVLVPSQAVIVNGEPRVGWYEINLATGETTSLLDDGSHGTNEQAALYFSEELLLQTMGFGFGVLAALTVGNVATFARNLAIKSLAFSVAGKKAAAIASIVTSYQTALAAIEAIPSADPVLASFHAGVVVGKAFVIASLLKDPPLPSGWLLPEATNIPPTNDASATVSATSALSGGTVSANVSATSLQIDGALNAIWSAAATSAFDTQTLSAASATVSMADGTPIGTGAVSLNAAVSIQTAVSGSNQFHVTGVGSLTSYGAAGSSLGVSGDWHNYSATVTGNVSVLLTTDGLVLNGQTLPSGTYRISTLSVALAGSGQSVTPSFAGAIDITAAGATAHLGAATGAMSVGGQAIDSSQGLSLVGFSGNCSVTGNATATDAVIMNGTATSVLAVAATPAGTTTDQNTPVTITPNIRTSVSGDYLLSVHAPPHWTATVDESGGISITPAPGVQSGVFPVRIVAASIDHPGLVAQKVVNVTITPTQAGIDLSVDPDPIISVPVDGAELPAGFRVSITNLGPAADRFNLSFSNLPSGFTAISTLSGTSVGAAQTGILGLYLTPTVGTPLPAPGTVLTFNVTATSTTNAAITQTRPVTFTVPALDAVTVTADPSSVATTPGAGVLAVIKITNVGNVPETVNLTAITSSGLSLSGLNSVTLAVGQSVNQTIVLTPDAATPLNSTLSAIIDATFGSSGTAKLQIPVRVAVPGADAIAKAAAAATQLGNVDLASRLNDLSVALTNLVQDPASDLHKTQALAALDTLIGLLKTDPFASAFVPSPFLLFNRDQLASAATAQQVQSAAIQLGNTLTNVATTLADAAKYKFTLSLVQNSLVGAPQVPVNYQVVLQNTGTQPATYDLSVFGLPGGATGSISPTTITLQPGQVSPGSPGVPDIFATITSNSTAQISPFSFQVRATVQSAPAITRTATGQFNPRGEVLKVVSVAATPPFTNASGLVNITANILNAVNQQQTANVTYTIGDSLGNIVYALPQPVPVTLNVLTTLTPVNLGQFDTTGLANGTYTITVNVNGIIGTGTLLIGTPVTATLSTTPTTAPTGNVTVTNTLQIDSQTPLSPPLGLVGQQAVAGSAGVAVSGNFAYVGTGTGIHIVNVANPAQPQELSTFGAADIPAGTVVHLQVYQDKLVAYAHSFAGNSNKLLIYSIANPAAPTLVGQTAVQLPGNQTASGTFWGISGISNNLVLISSLWYRYFIFSGQIFGQFGENIVIDISNPAAPAVTSAVYNQPPNPTLVYPDGTSWPDGSSNTWQAVAADNNTWLVATTSATGDSYSGPNVKGQVMVVDTTNPAAPVVLKKLEIPNTAVITGISVENNRALFIGSTQYWGSGTVGITGNIVVGALDITDPDNPTVLTSQITGAQSQGVGNLLSLGNGKFVTNAGNDALNNNNSPRLILVDATNVNDIVVTPQSVPQGVIYFATAAGLLFTTDNSNLLIYNFAAAPSVIPTTASVEIPKNTGVTIVPNSFSIPPTQIITGASSDTLIWDVSLAAVSPNRIFTWQTLVTNLQPGESRTVDLGATVEFTSQGTPGEIDLPPQFVAGQQVIGLTPPTRTIAPGETTNYTVVLKNPLNFGTTFELTVQGLSPGWVSVPFQTQVPAGGTVNVPLTITPDAFAPLADYQFTVTVRFGASIAFVEGDLILQGQPVEPDPESHGVVVSLTPAIATTGQGMAANYVARVTNAGSAAETFHLAAAGLPAGFVATFAQNDIEVPPGAFNFIDIPLQIVTPTGVAATSYPFTVTATSTAANSVTDTASAALNVTALGVRVDITQTSAAPGSVLQLVVTNTGGQADTFDLALGGPAGLVSSLSVPSVTLGAGVSQTVTIQVGNIDFAVPGGLLFSATATSRTNTALKSTDTATITINGFQGLTADFTPATKQTPTPATVPFLLTVNNTGNTEDAYFATIVSTTGPLTASLVGLDGLPTQTIDTFRLPGLSTGAILLNAALGALGQGTARVQVRSLTTNALVAEATATLATPTPSTADLSVTIVDAPDPAAAGGLLTYTVTVANSGPQPATNVVLTDVLPAGVFFVSATPRDAADQVTQATGTVTANLGTIASGASDFIKIVVRAPATPVRLTNTASATATEQDPSSANNTNISQTTDVVIVNPLSCQCTTLNAPGSPGSANVIADADHPGEMALRITGTRNADVIVVEPMPKGQSGQMRVVRGGKVILTFLSTDVQNIVIFGQEGNDKITVSAALQQPAIIFGGAGNDAIVGGGGDDHIDGGNGNDSIVGGAGNDMLCGGNGNDVIVGGLGNDVLGGDAGNDVLNGDLGNDLLLGGVGNDTLDGAVGDDRLYGQAGNDKLIGGYGNNVLIAGAGNDTLVARFGRNILIGGAGSDTLTGNDNDDILIAGSTTHDQDDQALQALLAEWASDNSYAARLSNLRNGGGINGPYALNNTTVLDDRVKDTIYGNLGLDWFWTGVKDTVKDRKSNEQVS